MSEENKEINIESTSRIINAEDLLNLHNISLDDWNIEKQYLNSWEVGSKTPNGDLVSTPLYQVKLILKNKQLEKDIEFLRQDFIDFLKEKSPSVNKIEYNKKYQEPNMLQINIFDFHFGKICWDEETNNNYNIKIATERFNECIDYFISEFKHKNIEKILLPITNDFFNSDKAYPFNSTTKGTPQEESLRWQDTFRKGRKLLLENIEKLNQIAPVHVVIIPGNHDFERSFYLGDSLEGWFHNNNNVFIDNKANPRKYFTYGKVLLGLTHGNEEKINDLPMLMAQESIDWSNTTYREWHLGHWHHKKEIKYKSTEEYQGVIIRYMSSLSGTDDWHHKKGYISSRKSAEALLWDSKKGLQNQTFYNI